MVADCYSSIIADSLAALLVFRWLSLCARVVCGVLTAAPVWDVHLCAPASRSAQHLARLKHPLVLRLLSPLEETRTQMVFVTEAVVSSLADYLTVCEGPPPPLSVSHPGNHASPSAVRMSELELKHGVLQMADAIHFLHSGASMAHRGICPHAVFIARAGGVAGPFLEGERWWGHGDHGHPGLLCWRQRLSPS